MVPFGGWDMPVEYSGLISEHMAVRKAAGLFDVSHMGEFEVEGPGALAVPPARDLATTWPSSSTARRSTPRCPCRTGRPWTTSSCIGAPPTATSSSSTPATSRRTSAGCRSRGRRTARSANRSDAYALIALQGPRAQEILQPLTALDLAALKYYHFAEAEVDELSGHRLPHRLHRRGRLRDLRAARARGGLLEAPARGRPREGPRPRRPRGARHAAPGGEDVPLRPGHGRDDDARRGRPRLDRLPRRGQGRLSGPRRAGRAEEERRRRASSWASRSPAAGSRATAIPCSCTTSGSAR